MSVLTCGELSARLPLRWGVVWNQWLSEVGVMPARALPMAHCRWTASVGCSFQECKRSLVTQKKACVLGGSPGTAVLFFSPPFCRMTGNFHPDQSAKVA